MNDTAKMADGHAGRGPMASLLALVASRWAGSALIWLLALAIMLPEMLLGTSNSYSILYNTVWGEQYPALMAQGTLYPRWLPASWDGLGSPTFYFYGPLSYWMAGAIHILSVGQIPAAVALSLSSAVFIAVSGMVMRRWLARLTTPGWALAGALLYVLAPYRFHDIYNRGSLGEAATYAALPIIMLALFKLKRAERFALPMLAGGVAMMLLGHLPVSLLASVSIIPAYVFWMAREAGRWDWAYIGRALAGGLLGIAGAAFYWMPAVALLPYAASEQLTTRYFSPESWFLFHGPNSIFSKPILDLVLQTFFLTTGYFVIALAGWMRNKGQGGGFWAALALACFLMISGLVPFIWSLPGLHQVQFPSRQLSIMEFVAITAIAVAGTRYWMPGLAFGLLFVGAGAADMIGMGATRMLQVTETGASQRAYLLTEMRDAPEYLPKGFAIAMDPYGRADPDKTKLPAVPLADIGVGGRIDSVVVQPDSGLSVIVKAARPVTVTVRRFYFPHWTVKNQSDGTIIPVIASKDKLVSWQAPVGTHHFVLSQGWAPFERLGLGLSLLTLLALGGLVWRDRQRSV